MGQALPSRDADIRVQMEAAAELHRVRGYREIAVDVDFKPLRGREIDFDRRIRPVRAAREAGKIRRPRREVRAAGSESAAEVAADRHFRELRLFSPMRNGT